jgi:hypothetical protein
MVFVVFFEKWKKLFITVTLNNSAVADFAGRLMSWGLFAL